MTKILKEMEDSRFSQMVQEEILNIAEEDNYLQFTLPMDFCSVSNTSSIILNELAKIYIINGKIEAYEDGNRVYYHYYSKDDNEVFHTIRENNDGKTCEIIYLLKGGEHRVIKAIRTITHIIDCILEEEQVGEEKVDNSDDYDDLPF